MASKRGKMLRTRWRNWVGEGNSQTMRPLRINDFVAFVNSPPQRGHFPSGVRSTGVTTP
jgi:hypothetical protein